MDPLTVQCYHILCEAKEMLKRVFLCEAELF